VADGSAGVRLSELMAVLSLPDEDDNGFQYC
jgi:hypothetical protein